MSSCPICVLSIYVTLTTISIYLPTMTHRAGRCTREDNRLCEKRYEETLRAIAPGDERGQVVSAVYKRREEVTRGEKGQWEWLHLVTRPVRAVYKRREEVTRERRGYKGEKRLQEERRDNGSDCTCIMAIISLTCSICMAPTTGPDNPTPMGGDSAITSPFVIGIRMISITIWIIIGTTRFRSGSSINSKYWW